jgi:hypothetical protein
MKTKNNAQGNGNNQFNGMIFRSITVIVSVVLISWTVGAQNFWEQVLISQNAGNLAMTGTENPFEKSQSNLMTSTFEMKVEDLATNSSEANFESVETELELQVEAYNASEYVNAEISEETENFLNTGNEAIIESIEANLESQVEAYNADEFVEAELSDEAENWSNSNTEIDFDALGEELELQVGKYNAADFVDTELLIDTESSRINTSVDFDTIETELDLQVGEYNAAEYVETEIANEAGLITDVNFNETLEADLAPQMDQIMLSTEYNAENYISADMAREIENARAQKEFLNKAENETAQEAEKEVEKYAMLLVSHINSESK